MQQEALSLDASEVDAAPSAVRVDAGGANLPRLRQGPYQPETLRIQAPRSSGVCAMATNTVTKLTAKSLNDPDERRRPDKTVIDVVNLGEHTVGRFTFDPGWRWSECIKPVVNTESCQNNHIGYCVSGSLEIHLDTGESVTIKAGDSFTIPPGHDAWVVGDETFVGIEFLSAAAYAKPD